MITHCPYFFQENTGLNQGFPHQVRQIADPIRLPDKVLDGGGQRCGSLLDWFGQEYPLHQID